MLVTIISGGADVYLADKDSINYAECRIYLELGGSWWTLQLLSNSAITLQDN